MDRVAQIRSFNRVVTQRIGALEDSYLARGRPLGEARVLFEIGLAEGIDLKVLRAKLSLDSGYLSRMLRSLECQGVVMVGKSAADGRVRQAKLTARGHKDFEAYNARSDQLARSILDRLSSSQQKRLTAAMADVERLFLAASVEIGEEQPQSADARWCLEQYYIELSRRFDSGFDPLAGNNFDPAEMKPPRGWFVLARLDGSPAGCGALKRLEEGVGEIKRVWTAGSARGMGVASRLMERLEGLAREAGFSVLRLDTNKTLTEAHALYQKLGYHEIGRYNDNPYADHWFEKSL